MAGSQLSGCRHAYLWVHGKELRHGRVPRYSRLAACSQLAECCRCSAHGWEGDYWPDWLMQARWAATCGYTWQLFSCARTRGSPFGLHQQVWQASCSPAMSPTERLGPHLARPKTKRSFLGSILQHMRITWLRVPTSSYLMAQAEVSRGTGAPAPLVSYRFITECRHEGANEVRHFNRGACCRLQQACHKLNQILGAISGLGAHSLCTAWVTHQSPTSQCMG